MRTIYLKDSKKLLVETGNCFYWKVTEIDGNTTSIVEVTKNRIEISDGDYFLKEVEFIKDVLCEGMYKVITKMEFDTFYIKTVHAINDAMNLEIEVKSLEDEMEEFNKGLRNILSS